MCFSSNSELIRSQKEVLSHHGNVYNSGASKKILISFSLSPGLSLWDQYRGSNYSHSSTSPGRNKSHLLSKSLCFQHVAGFSNPARNRYRVYIIKRCSWEISVFNLSLGSPCRHLYCCKDIVLRRSTSGSLGFSIVGGQEEVNCNQSFFIRSIVEGTPAYNDGRIRYAAHHLILPVNEMFYLYQWNVFFDCLLGLCRCGDILLEVNGKSTWGMTHTALVRLLKELRGRITLTIVSWPGSLL